MKEALLSLLNKLLNQKDSYIRIIVHPKKLEKQKETV